MPTWVEILCCLDEEIGLVCWQLVHDMHAMQIFGIQPSCKTFFIFYETEWTCWVFLLPVKKLGAFERNQNLEKQLSDVLEMNSLTLMKVLTFFSEIFP